MRNWTAFGKAMISLFLAIFIPAAEYTDLIVVHDEPVTITTTLVSCETEKRSSRSGTKTTIYFEIDQFPYRLGYTNPPKLQEALLQRCRQKDKVSLTYRQVYSRIHGEASYLLYSMESLTDGQIILTSADIEAYIERNRCFISPLVIFFIVAFFFYFMQSRMS